ncbi:MAG: class I adenylate-forming enzyme family protein [Gammaproteobacteria bacterium]|nr:class I adenylate-forming enzyme family protein [Gammaproteobacteria bacterium]
MKVDPAQFRDKRIFDYLYRHAGSAPGKLALSNGNAGYSYRELLLQVEACARGLLASGVNKGDRVATLSPPHPDYFIIFLATSAIGGIWVGLNSRYTRAELEHVIADSEPCVIFARTRIGARDYREDLRYFQGRIDSVKHIVTLDEDAGLPGAVSYRDFLARQAEASIAALAAAQKNVVSDDAALLVYTSGTTGKPKGALLHHYGAIRHCQVQGSLRPAGELRQLNAYPINHIAGVIAGSVYGLVFGGTTYFLEKFDPATVLKLIEEKRISAWGGVPVMLQRVLDHPDFPGADLSSVRVVAYSGGMVSKALLERIVRDVCPAVATMYGLTEATGTVTAVAATDDVELLAETIGKPVADCEFRLADDAGKPVAKGEHGEIQLRGPFIMKGYWRLPEATREAIDEDGWLRTKDVALERDDGNIVLVGRLSDMYKSGGYNVYPSEIEQALEAHPSVNLACVVGVPDTAYGEVGYAFVTPALGQSPDSRALLEHCRARLAGYKLPKHIIIEDELPVLANNKPDKRRLKAAARKAVAPDAAQPRSSGPS